MSSIKTPKITFDLIENQDSVGNAKVKVLFIGQQLSSATATANELVPVGVSGEQVALFGKYRWILYHKMSANLSL